MSDKQQPSGDWKWAYGAGAVGGLIFFGLIIFVATDANFLAIWNHIKWATNRDGHGVLQTATYLFTPLAAVYGIYLLNRRTKALELTLKHQQQTALEQRFKDGVDLLFREDSTRLGGAAILEDLATAHAEIYRKRTIEVFIDILKQHRSDNLEHLWTLEAELSEISELKSSALSAIDDGDQDPGISHYGARLDAKASELADARRIETIRAEIAVKLGRLRFAQRPKGVPRKAGADDLYIEYSPWDLFQRSRGMPPLIFLGDQLDFQKCDFSDLVIRFESKQLALRSCFLDRAIIVGKAKLGVHFDDCCLFFCRL